MKKLIAVLLLTLSFTANATTYYFSVSGNDANNGTSTSTPWKSLSKFNSVFASKSPGDNFLFKRGDVFYGRITISRSGSSGSPITIGAYGTGAMPVISGFTTVSAWTSLGGNIWESTGAISNLPYTNMVTVNGVNTPMGRYPNTGYLVWQSHTGNVAGSSSTITSSSLTGSTNWTGAEVAFNTTTYMVSRDKITAQSGGTLSYKTPSPADLFQAPSTYFVQSFTIQNDARTLDMANEWYYNSSTKKLRIYNTSTPSKVQIATVDTLAYVNGRSYITFDNISFQGANSTAIECNYNSTYITVQNCDFNFSGKNAVHGLYTSNLTGIKVQNCTINHSNNNAIDVGMSANATISNNTIKNTAMIRGMISVGGKTGEAITAEGANVLIANNTIDSVGYTAIRFLSSNTIIQNNYVKNFCLIQYDGGGIETWNGPKVTYSGIKILNNIILNGNIKNHAIYLDQAANGILIQGNTAINCERGIYLDNAFNITVRNNTCYNNTYGLLMDKRDVSVTGANIVVKNNIFFAKTSAQRVVWDLTAVLPSMPIPFTSDSNYYARPVDDNMTFQTYLNAIFTQRNLAGWQLLNLQDAHSKKSPKAITDTNDLRIEYNETSSSKTVSLPYSYIDVKNVLYNGTITLAPYSSAVLIKYGAITGGGLLPAVNPANTVNGLDYKYYEGTFPVVPTFSSLTPKKTGNTTTPVISMANRTYGYSFNFTGFVNVPADGQYTFYTTSDDGSNLIIDNVLVVNNDGLHSSLEKSGTVGLKAGKHAISIGYTQATGGNVLSVSYAGPGSLTKQAIPGSALFRISAQGLGMSMNTAISDPTTQVGVKAYPNPFTNYIEVNITGIVAGEYKLMLVDAAGKIVWTKSGIKNAGDFTQSINTSALQRGIYFLKVIQNNTSSVIKVVK